jgi:agmatinase
MEVTGSSDQSPQASFLDAVHLPAFSATGTFKGAERTEDPAGADLVVMGVQFDLGAVNRPGARFGPRAIRQQSIYAGALQPVYPWDVELSEAFRMVDRGDVVVVPAAGAVETMIEQTQAAATEVFGAGASLLTLGGDHTIPYGPVRAAAEVFGPLAMIHLDSHQDSLDGEGLINHGTFATALVNEGHINASRSAQLYIRTLMDNPAGYTIHYAEDARQLGPEELAAQVRALAGDGPVYLSLDIDAIDPAFAPGVGTPVPGGPSSSEVRRFLKGLDGLDIVAADIVELNPPHDPAEVTAILAAFLSFDLLHLLGNARRRRAGI